MSTRSHQGCWTCKRRRRRCDKQHPTCQNCADRGVECEGYEVRLRWGTGVASRGQFTGAEKPLKECVPMRPKGRRRDLSKERKLLQVSAPSDATSPSNQRFETDDSPVDSYTMGYGSEQFPVVSERSKQDEMLFQECESIQLIALMLSELRLIETSHERRHQRSSFYYSPRQYAPAAAT